MTIQIPYEAMPKMTPDISKDFQLGPIFTLEICLLILARKLLVFHCNRGSQQKNAKFERYSRTLDLKIFWKSKKILTDLRAKIQMFETFSKWKSSILSLKILAY